MASEEKSYPRYASFSGEDGSTAVTVRIIAPGEYEVVHAGNLCDQDEYQGAIDWYCETADKSPTE